MRVKKFTLLAMLLVLLLPFTALAQGDVVEITMGSWRTEDIEQWDAILSVFHAEYPNIHVNFEPSLNTEYNSQIQTLVAAGEGPDLITCRPFDVALGWYQIGGLADISDLPGLENFSDVALGAWSTDDKSATYCVPMATVIHGFIYNKEVFAELGLEEPRTESEFFAVLDAIQASGMTPLAIATKDNWAISTMGFNNLWPNFCDGENTRLGLIAGDVKMTDQCFVDTFASIQRWAPYMPDGFQSIGYADTQQLFPLGMAAIYPAGSWEIPLFNSLADFEMGAFRPYQPDDRAPEDCWIDDHVDIAVGMNANTAHPEEARTFLEWLTTQAFAQTFFDNQPGFFPLGQYELTPPDDPLAAAFLSWRSECGSTIRLFDQFLRRNSEHDTTSVYLYANMPLLMDGDLTPEEMAALVQEGVDQQPSPMGSD
jgi:raffinose/stachyose/melibiose transport system substrate-binding protein